jgi:hypothetical protein
MGGQAQPNAPTQVYYDPEKQQYFSYKPQTSGNFLVDMLSGGMNADVSAFNGQPLIKERNYLNNPFINQNRFKTNAQATPYAELTNLFPSLNTSSVQGLMSPTQTDGAMYGAGRFLAPQTNNTQGK